MTTAIGVSDTQVLPCDRCGLLTERRALSGWLWVCFACHPTGSCCECGALARPVGVDRFAVLRAGNDSYALDQAVAYRCGNGHLTFGEAHKGPGAQR